MSGSFRSATKGYCSRFTFALDCEGLGKLTVLTPGHYQHLFSLNES